ncbi:MAG: hypothetical protein PXX77_08535 [Gallionella sp.]|nr:hypothetical protein [Gallionella sp.]
MGFVIPAQAGIQMLKDSHDSGEILWFGRASKLADSGSFCPLRGIYYCWIPACAGMTVLVY